MPEEQENKSLAHFFCEAYLDGKVSDQEFRRNLAPMLIDWQSWGQIMRAIESFKLVLDVPGDVCEFGTRYGA